MVLVRRGSSNAAVLQLEPFVGHRHHRGVMRRQQERHAFTGERTYPVQHSFARRVIELGGGFVSDDDAGACRDRLGECGSLLLSPGELGGQMVDPIADVQEIEQPVRVEVVRPAGTAASRETQMLSDREMRQEVVRRPLIDVADEVSPEVPSCSR